MLEQDRDIADVHLRIKVRTAYRAVVALVVATATLVLGWVALKQDVAEAKAIALDAKRGLAEVTCYIEQMHAFQIFGKVPEKSCRDTSYAFSAPAVQR